MKRFRVCASVGYANERHEEPIAVVDLIEGDSGDWALYEEAQAEVRQARSFAEEAAKKHNDLLASNRVTCAYCGHQYAEGAPEAKSAALTAHIAQCEAHPMRQLGASLCTLMSLPFPPTDRALAEMRLGVSLMAAGDDIKDDIKTAFSALDALRVFLPNSFLDGLGEQGGEG